MDRRKDGWKQLWTDIWRYRLEEWMEKSIEISM